MQGFFQSTEVQLPVPLTTIVPSGASYSPLSELASSPGSTAGKDDGPIDILPLKITLISRRSTNRPGLRFQRRGVDADGNVANFVETEFIVGATTAAQDTAVAEPASLAPKAGKKFVASFVQTRGSIPLYWSQAPSGLKPPPVLDERGPEENAGAAISLSCAVSLSDVVPPSAALSKHFSWHAATYGAPTIAVCLAEQHGAEGKVVNAYEAGVEELLGGLGTVDTPPAAYCGWDFHVECRGMKYENIRKLLDKLSADLEKQGWGSMLLLNRTLLKLIAGISGRHQKGRTRSSKARAGSTALTVSTGRRYSLLPCAVDALTSVIPSQECRTICSRQTCTQHAPCSSWRERC